MQLIEILAAVNTLLLVPIYFALSSIHKRLDALHQTDVKHAEQIGYLKGKQTA